MVIHSKDDPIVPVECLPIDECTANKNIIVGIVRNGGHCCYFTGVGGRVRWYPLVTGEYLDSIVEINELKKLDKVQGSGFDLRINNISNQI